MDVRKGDLVLVNVAPFIGSPLPNRDSIPCRVLAIDDAHVEVKTQEPYRTITLWVQSKWIQGKVSDEPHGVAHLAQELDR